MSTTLKAAPASLPRAQRQTGKTPRPRAPRPRRARQRPRVVVTGIGLVSPLGNSVDQFWARLIDGVSAVKLVTRFDPERFSCRLAAEVESYQLPLVAPKYLHEMKRMDRFVQYALVATASAFAASRFPLDRLLAADGGGFFFGVAMGGLGTIENGVLVQERRGPHKTSPYLIPSLIPNMAAGMVALAYGFNGPQYTIVGGCSSGIQAIGQAMDSIRSGERSWALAGGSEAVITPITFSGFQAMAALSPALKAKRTPRPFDRRRDGMIVGEGAAMLVLEERRYAERRGAPILAELTGYSTSTVTSQAFFQCSDETVRCMELVLADGGLDRGDLDCVYAHAGGLSGDASEMKAICKLFAGTGRGPAVTSIKGHIGYSFAGAGPLDLAAGVLALGAQQLTPTLNFRAAEPEFAGLDIVARPRATRLRNCMINSFGLGGVNACLLLTEAR